MRIVVDRTCCAGLGVCESIAPKHFEVDDDGELVLLQEQVSDAERSDVDEAVAGCPTGALSLTDD
jgi:ferredoxin